MFNPEYNYHRAIDSLRAEINRLVGGNLADQQQIRDHVVHLRKRIATLKSEHDSSVPNQRISDHQIDYLDPPISKVPNAVLVDEAGLTPVPSGDVGNGMMPDELASDLQSDE